MSFCSKKNESNKNNFQLQFLQLPWLALSTPDVATKPSRPYRLGIWQMQSDLATNLSPGWKWPARLVWLNFWWQKHKTAFWHKLWQVFVTHFFYVSFLRQKTQHHPPLCWCRFLCRVEIWKISQTILFEFLPKRQFERCVPGFQYDDTLHWPLNSLTYVELNPWLTWTMKSWWVQLPGAISEAYEIIPKYNWVRFVIP